MNQFRDLYPFQSHFLKLPRANYHYVDEGEGEVLLMIHGNPSWSFLYRDLIKKFSSDYRVIAPDHIGCGLSDKPHPRDYSYTLEQRVHDLEVLVDHLGLDQITLVVHDWGGMIGLAFATRHPEKIKRLILFNTAAFPKPKAKAMPWSISLCRNRIFGPLLVQGFNAFNRGATYFCTVKPLSASVKEGFLWPYQNWHQRHAIFQFVRDIPMKSGDPSFAILKETAQKLKVFDQHPILILWGEQDFVFDHHFLQEWQRIWPHASVKTFPKAGHYILEDAGPEIINDAKRFLEQVAHGGSVHANFV